MRMIEAVVLIGPVHPKPLVRYRDVAKNKPTEMLQRIREDFKSGVRGDVNGTPTFFINGERYDGDLNLKYLLNALKPQKAEGAKR